MCALMDLNFATIISDNSDRCKYFNTALQNWLPFFESVNHKTKGFANWIVIIKLFKLFMVLILGKEYQFIKCFIF